MTCQKGRGILEIWNAFLKDRKEIQALEIISIQIYKASSCEKNQLF